MIRVAFICVHNSCRSQIAEALGKRFAADVFESYSAGTELKDHINPDAVRLVKELYGIDMELTQTLQATGRYPTCGCGRHNGAVMLNALICRVSDVKIGGWLTRPARVTRNFFQ